MNKEWAEIERQLEKGYIKCKTIKLTISGRDLYYKIGYAQDRPVFLDITVGQNAGLLRNHEEKCISCDMKFLNLDANELEAQLVSGFRASLEVFGRMATAMLQSKVWSIDNLIDMWKETKFEPSGLCMQVEAIDPVTMKEIEGSASIVKSPLDAFAKYAERKSEEWKNELCTPTSDVGKEKNHNVVATH